MSGKILIGIDEAGLGPRLGPLVVSMVSFRTPKSPKHLSIQELLSNSLSKDAPLAGNRVRVDDSKRVYRGTSGLAHLEKTALSFWLTLHGKLPRTLGDWLEKFAPETPAALAECPWYGPAPLELSLPLLVSPRHIEQTGERLKAEMDSRDVQPVRFLQEIITAPNLNRLIRRFDSKSAALHLALARLIPKVVSRNDRTPCRIDVDKLGGRAYYGDVIRSIFPMHPFSIEEESRALSSYRLGPSGQETRIGFHRGGDGCHTHIALASIFSKYARELFMHLFNRFWQGHLPCIKPTAGYPLDAARFLKEVEPMARSAGIEPGRFIRIR